MSRLSIEIEEEQHRLIKTLATFSGMSIKDYILSKTLPRKEKKKTETEMLLSSPKNARRLREALKSPKSEHLRFKTLKDLEDALGI